MKASLLSLALVPSLISLCPASYGQEYGEPDRGEPGDVMIQEFLAGEANRLHATFMENVESLEDWEAIRPQYQHEYFHMLGLWPIPDKTPLHATVTKTLEREGYAVDMLHYQSRPGLYVTANLYRPSNIKAGERLPAILYVCGHSYQGRSGNKTAYQSHGIWFAKHGYLCLVLDSLQLGEIAALHHGTYRENRWWWHSRGYTPAGVEAWNGVRGIDYLRNREDVDPERIAVTGISGGGAATFWIAAADERAGVAVPVSGMADLPSYVGNRVINGHCDCMFFYNTFQWPWTRIASLIAPRPMLFTNSDADPIFPMDANDRVIHRLERVYSLYGRSDFVDAMVSIGGHAYRKDIRQAVYRFINTHFKNDPHVVQDSEKDLITREDGEKQYPIPIEQLRVFSEDSDIPDDELNTTIDEHFVPMAEVAPPERGQFNEWRDKLLKELRRISFRVLPEQTDAAKAKQVEGDSIRLETEPGIDIALKRFASQEKPANQGRVLLGVAGENSEPAVRAWMERVAKENDTLYFVEPRGVGASRWTRKNPPNYVERSHVLLGHTADTGRVRDLMATVRYLEEKHPEKVIAVAGVGSGGILAAYAALWSPGVGEVLLKNPPLTHMQAEAPQFLNVLRVCDIPDVLGMLAPRKVTVAGLDVSGLEKVRKIFSAAGAPGLLEENPDD